MTRPSTITDTAFLSRKPIEKFLTHGNSQLREFIKEISKIGKIYYRPTTIAGFSPVKNLLGKLSPTNYYLLEPHVTGFLWLANDTVIFTFIDLNGFKEDLVWKDVNREKIKSIIQKHFIDNP